ncbi:hypothetical protein ACF3MZ_11570 [Paenibacillaceae bacterium WGS1546]|uniref:hypothetical protein n=1 Tax=Cohnella sp. WGS1546 TaxID=3366810 RepID=UPI00372D83CC
MAVSWRFVIGFGAFGALLTMAFSLSSNPFGTTMLRSLYALLAFSGLGLLAKLALGALLNPGARGAAALEPNPDEQERGSMLDLSTPDEEEALSEMLKRQWAEGKAEPIADFQPLQPKRVVSLDHPNPEEVAQAIRRLTDE